MKRMKNDAHFAIKKEIMTILEDSCPDESQSFDVLPNLSKRKNFFTVCGDKNSCNNYGNHPCQNPDE